MRSEIKNIVRQIRMSTRLVKESWMWVVVENKIALVFHLVYIDFCAVPCMDERIARITHMQTHSFNKYLLCIPCGCGMVIDAA